MQMKRKNYIKGLSAILIITVLGKAFGFVRELVLAYCYGTGKVVDTFIMAESLPSVFFGWTTAFATAFVPVYQSVKQTEPEERQKSYATTMLFSMTCFSAIFVIIGITFARQIIDISAQGFSKEQKELTYAMYIICTLTYLYYSQIQLITNYLNCREQFVKATVPTLLLSPIQTGFVLLSFFLKRPVLLAIGVAASTFAQMIMSLCFAIHEGLSLKGSICFSREVRRTFKMGAPLFLSTIVTRLNILIDKTFASGLPEGSISALSYGENLRTIFYSVISLVITSMLYPVISKKVAEKNYNDVNEHARQTVRILISIVIPLTVCGCVLAQWGTTIIYMRGKFDQQSMMMTAGAFSMYMIGLLSMLIRDLGNSISQAYQNSTIPLVTCTIIVGVNIVLNICLVKPLGHIGLAMSTSIANILIVPAECIAIRKKYTIHMVDKKEMILLWRCIVSSGIAGVTTMLVTKMWNNVFLGETVVVKILILVVAAIIFMLIYILALCVYYRMAREKIYEIFKLK